MSRPHPGLPRSQPVTGFAMRVGESHAVEQHAVKQHAVEQHR